MAVERQQGEAAEVQAGAEGEEDVEEEEPGVKVAMEGVVEEATQPQPPDPGLAFPLVAPTRMAPHD